MCAYRYSHELGQAERLLILVFLSALHDAFEELAVQAVLLVVVALETLASKDFDLEGIACEKQAEEIGLHIITVEYETAGA